MSTFSIKQHDTLPVLSAQLVEAAGTRQEEPIDLTSATSVRFIMRPWTGGDVKVDAGASITSASEGRVAYVWSTGDTDTPGTFAAEWEVTFPSGTMTFPSNGFDQVTVVDDLA